MVDKFYWFLVSRGEEIIFDLVLYHLQSVTEHVNSWHIDVHVPMLLILEHLFWFFRATCMFVWLFIIPRCYRKLQVSFCLLNHLDIISAVCCKVNTHLWHFSQLSRCKHESLNMTFSKFQNLGSSHLYLK